MQNYSFTLELSLQPLSPKIPSAPLRSLNIQFSHPLSNLTQSLDLCLKDLSWRPLLQPTLIPKQLPAPKYQSVCLGGTFDQLHIGHQLLLLTAILQTSKYIVIGITTPSMLAKKENKILIQHLNIRKKKVEEYIRKIKPELVVQIVQITDPFGPAIDPNRKLEALIVSPETQTAGPKINTIRKQLKIPELKIEICPLIQQVNTEGAKISSSSIRKSILQKNNMAIGQIEEYKRIWVRLYSEVCNLIKVEPDQQYMQVWWDRILNQYSEYWRFYHTNYHIYSLLKQLQQSTSLTQKFTQSQRLSLLLSIWFHDVEYLPSQKNNEEQSAETAKQFLLGLTKEKNDELHEIIQFVVNAIMSTKNHKATTDIEKVLIDLDMGILDSPWESYEEYAQNIRRQYQPFAGELYPVKRIEFLKSMEVQKIFYFRKPENLEKNIQLQMQKLAQC